jgi:starch phosphorylase
VGDRKEHGDDPAWDAHEATVLYDLLEHEVIPEFYARDEKGIPTAWIERMRESMAQLTPQFSANRTVRAYTERHYIPAADAYLRRVAERGAMGAQLVEWQRVLREHWPKLRFGEMKVTTDGENRLFEVRIYLGGLDPNAVRVELYADGVNGGGPLRQEMAYEEERVDANGAVYTTRVPATRPASDYTARVVAKRSGVAVPLEAAQILWQR